MKIPHEVIGRTRPSSQGLTYFNVDSSPIARAGQAIGSALSNLGATIEQQRSNDERFDALTKFSEFETSYAEAETELRRSVDPGDASYRQRSEALFDNLSGDFVSKLAPSVQKEFQARIAQYKKGAMSGTLEFDYTQRDTWYRNNISKVYVDANNELGKAPTKENLAVQQVRVAEIVQASNLSELEKTKLEQELQAQLLLTTYRGALKAGEFGGNKARQSGGKAGVQISKDVAVRAAQARAFFEQRGWSSTAAAGIVGNLIAESNLNPGAKNPKDPGTSVGLAQWNRERKAALVLFARRNGTDPTDFMTQLAFVDHELRTSEKSVGDKLRAAKSVEEATDAGISYERPVGWTVDNPRGGHNYSGRLKYARSVLGGGTSDVPEYSIAGDLEDPAFASIPLEDRLAAQRDAAVFHNAQRAELIAQQKAEYDTFLESFKVNAYNGKLGMVEALQALNNGQFREFKDFQSIENIIQEKEGNTDKLLEAQSRADAGLPLSSEQSNLIFDGEDGEKKLAAGDVAYGTKLLRGAQANGDFPSKAMNLLVGQIYNTNPQKAKFAYDTLAQLASLGPQQAKNVPSEILENVELYRQLRLTMDDVKAIETIAGGATPAEREARRRLVDLGETAFDVKDIQGAPSRGYRAAQEKLEDIGAQAPGFESAQFQFHDWYRANWIAAYSKSNGDEKAATAATDALVDRWWGATAVGGKPQFLFLPPEKVGLPMYEESYDYLMDQGRKKLGLKEDQTFQLLADERTRNEYTRYQRGEGGPPSYLVLTFDADGTARMPTNARLQFTPDEALAARDDELFGLRQLEDKLIEMQAIVTEEKARAYYENREPNPEILKGYEELQERVIKENERVKPPKGWLFVDPGALKKLRDKTNEENKKLNPPNTFEPFSYYSIEQNSSGNIVVDSRGKPVGPLNDTTLEIEPTNTSSGKKSWLEFWKTQDVVVPQNFDYSKKFATFAVAKNPEEINAIWKKLENVSGDEAVNLATTLINQLPKGSLAAEDAKAFSEVVTTAAKVPLLRKGLSLIDPARIVIYSGENELNKGGTYTLESDWLFFDAKYPVAFIHETLHKTIASLEAKLAPREQEFLNKTLSYWGSRISGEEALVRYIMNSNHFSDVPYDWERSIGGSINATQIQAGKHIYNYYKDVKPVPKTKLTREWWPVETLIDSLTKLVEAEDG